MYECPGVQDPVYMSSYNQDPGGRGTGEGRVLHGSNRGSWNLPGGVLAGLGTSWEPWGPQGGALGASGTPPGAQRGAQSAKWTLEGFQKSSQNRRFSGSGVNVVKKWKLHSRRGASAIFEVRAPSTLSFFGHFGGSRINVENGTRPRWLKIGSLSSLGTPWEGPRAKMGPTRVSQGCPRGAKGAPKWCQNRGLLTSATR